MAGLWLATLFLLAQGCMSSSKGSRSDFFISSQEVRNVMFQEHLEYPMRGSDILDDYYMCPDEDWLGGRFAKYILPNYLAERKGSTWVSQSNDCDDFALHAMVLMRELHHNTSYKLTDTGIAFGVVSYTKEGVGLHMINWAIVKDRRTALPKLVFFEPQDAKGIVTLSDKEKDSIVFWLAQYENEKFPIAITANQYGFVSWLSNL